MVRRRFSREFKLEAVRLIRERGVSDAQAARYLDVHENQLRKWVREFATDPALAFPGQGQMKPEQLEIERLRREVAKLEAERDIKKSRDLLREGGHFWSKARQDGPVQGQQGSEKRTTDLTIRVAEEIHNRSTFRQSFQNLQFAGPARKDYEGGSKRQVTVQRRIFICSSIRHQVSRRGQPFARIPWSEQPCLRRVAPRVRL